MAIREVAKVYGLTDREIGRVSKRLPWFWRQAHAHDDLLTRLKQLPELGRLDFPQPWPQIIATAQRIIGIPRYVSVHPGGVVITPGPLTDYVPVELAPKGVPVIQWEKDATEESGLVEATFFPKTYRRFCAILDRTRPFMLYGKVEEDFGAVTLTVARVERITRVNAESTNEKSEFKFELYSAR